MWSHALWGGVEVICSPRKVLKFTCSEVASGGFWDPKNAES